jgi:hypothetical protein
MFFVPTRPVIYRQARILQLGRKHFFTQNPNVSIYKSNAFRAAIFGLVVSVPAGLLVQKSYNDISQPPSLSEFYVGSLEWKGKPVKPLSLNDAVTWLRQNESTQKGPVGSGVRRWYTVRCPSNFPCEDNLVATQCPVSGNSTEPWVFWGIFDGHR